MSFLSSPKSHKILFCLGLIASIILLFARFHISKSVAGGDAVYYYINLHSIVVDRDLDFRNEYEYFYNQVSSYTGKRKIDRIPPLNGVTERLPNKFTIGSAVLLTPFFYLAHISSLILDKAGLPVDTSGYGPAYMLSAGLGSLLYGFLGILLIYKLGRRLFNDEIAFVGSVSIWLATPIIYYMTMEPLMSHAVSMFLVTLFLYVWLTGRNKRGMLYWGALGMAGGVISMVRSQDVFFCIIPVIDALLSPFWEKGTDRAGKGAYRDVIAGIIIFSASFAIFGAPQFYVNYIFFGSPITSGYLANNEGFTYWNSPKVLYSLFSLHNGLFTWTPVAAFSLAGIFYLIKKEVTAGGLLLFSFLIQLYLVSAWWYYWQGDTFGNRMLVNSTFVFGIGLMELLWSNKDRTYYRTAIGLLGFLVIVNAVLAGLYCLRVIGNPY